MAVAITQLQALMLETESGNVVEQRVVSKLQHKQNILEMMPSRRVPA